MRRASLLIFLVACDRSAAPAVTPITPDAAAKVVAPVNVVANSGSLSTAACVVTPAADDVAKCPDPMAWSRGDGLGTSDSLPPIKATPLPADLEISRSFACAYACVAKGAEAHLMAWSIIEDARPLRNHNAVFLVEDPGKTPKWSVVVMYRHATNEAWNINVSFHRRARPVVTFEDKPTWKDVAAVMQENDWQTQDEPDGFRILAGVTLPAVEQTISP